MSKNFEPYAEDLDDAYDDGPGSEREPAPLFGCACENPSSVDTVCEACVAYLQEQDAEIERERLAKASAFTVEECVYWLAVVGFTGRQLSYACDACACVVRRADVGYVHQIAARLLSEVRLWRRYPGSDREGHYERQCLVAWALCREAIRAIERERAERERSGL
ncbi:MAG: hypothetical protein HOW73_47705 [Polyangiaceae bacterium]|nr:hypothetical protein [Polyangiaceae bacterium]